jgi:hypothetical protein
MTITTSASRPVRRDVESDRLFYSYMAIALAVTVFIGFGPTYYFALLAEGPAATITGQPLTTFIHLHGLLFTAWVLLFLTQTVFIATRRVKLHQRMGIAGAALAAAMVAMGMTTAIEGAGRGTAPPGIDPLAFLAVPFFDMVLFATFVSAALWNRRVRDSHKRLMLLAYISITAAATARLPGVLPLGPFAFYGLAFVFLGVAIAYDYSSRRRVHPTYIWGSALLVVSVPARLMLSETAAWKSFAAFLAG